MGIAVTAADTANGVWWYSTNNGASWNALGAVANNSARLLAADGNTRLYFQPNANYHGTLATAITFRSWDQSSGRTARWPTATSNGGTTAFSTATDTGQPGDQPSGRHAVGDQRHDQRGHADNQWAGDLAPRGGWRRGDAHFKITGITNGTLYQNDGTTPIGSGTFITLPKGTRDSNLRPRRISTVAAVSRSKLRPPTATPAWAAVRWSRPLRSTP